MSNIDAISANMAQAASSPDAIQDALRIMRTYLGMEISYLSEFVGDELVFRAVDAPGLEGLIKPGDRRKLSNTYCKHIRSGDLPQLIPDALDIPFAASLKVTHEVPIRAHVSVPIERRDGSLYGMFCCLSPEPNKTLNDRDLQLMKSFARLAQFEVQRVLEGQTFKRTMVDLIHSAVRDQSFDLVYQPIFDLEEGGLSGVEALCRFQSEPYRAPNLWFEDAARVGLAEMLEVCVMEPALAALDQLPEGTYLSLNASPQTVSTGLLAPIFTKRRCEGIVLEVTEHIEVDDWAALDRELHILREMGIKIAIDDAGSGYSGLQQMVRLRPDIIKLDRSLVARIDDDRALRSLCAAMVHYAHETGAKLVGEGIERSEELEALRRLGVDRGPGYLLARPMPLSQLLAKYGDGASPALASGS